MRWGPPGKAAGRAASLLEGLSNLPAALTSRGLAGELVIPPADPLGEGAQTEEVCVASLGVPAGQWPCCKCKGESVSVCVPVGHGTS